MKYEKVVDKFLGKTFTSNNYGDFTVLEYQDCSNVTIKFINTGTITITSTPLIDKGSVRDPSLKKAVGKRNGKKKCKFVGNVYSSSNYGDYVVEEYLGDDRVLIKFINTGSVRTTYTSQIRGGGVMDFCAEKVVKSKTNNIIHKVGNRGDDKSLIEENLKTYQVWCSMLQRCYSPRSEYMKRNYKDCEVSDYFKIFPQFLEWWKMKSEGISVDLQLDKDILIKGNRLYSETTCTLVPRDVNMLLIKRDKARGKYPIGVTYCKKAKRYKAQFSKFNIITHLGFYDDIEGAFLAYKQAKEDYIKEVANKYKDVIEDKVYEILMKYEVNIDD